MTGMETGNDGEIVDAIQAYLEQHGWEPESGEGWRWVEHSFDNGHGRLGVDYLPSSPRSLGFSYENENQEARLRIAFEDDPFRVLEVITQHQADLSEQTWPSFIAAVLARSPHVIAVASEEDEDDKVIRTVEEGTQALHEIDWEYLDENVDFPHDIEPE